MSKRAKLSKRAYLTRVVEDTQEIMAISAQIEFLNDKIAQLEGQQYKLKTEAHNWADANMPPTLDTGSYKVKDCVVEVNSAEIRKSQRLRPVYVKEAPVYKRI